MQQYEATVTDLDNVTGIILEPKHLLEDILIDTDCKEIAEGISKMFSDQSGAKYKVESSNNSYIVLGPNGPVFEVMTFDKKPPIYVRPHDEISNGDEYLLSRVIANQYAERFN